MKQIFTLITAAIFFNLTATANSQLSSTLVLNNKKNEVSHISFLPVYGFSIKVTNNDDKVDIWWRTETEVETKTFEIERSSDGINFFSLVVINGAKNSNIPLEYKRTDDNPVNGVNFYRVKETSSTNSISYSAVAKVKMTKDAIVKMYPNPVQERLTIQYNGMNPSLIKIIDGIGRTVKSILPNSINSFVSIDVASLAAGTYTVILFDKETIIQTDRILKR